MVSKMYGITGVPAGFILDRHGVIRKKVVGPRARDYPRLIPGTGTHDFFPMTPWRSRIKVSGDAGDTIHLTYHAAGIKQCRQTVASLPKEGLHRGAAVVVDGNGQHPEPVSGHGRIQPGK